MRFPRFLRLCFNHCTREEEQFPMLSALKPHDPAILSAARKPQKPRKPHRGTACYHISALGDGSAVFLGFNNKSPFWLARNCAQRKGKMIARTGAERRTIAKGARPLFAGLRPAEQGLVYLGSNPAAARASRRRSKASSASASSAVIPLECHHWPKLSFFATPTLHRVDQRDVGAWRIHQRCIKSAVRIHFGCMESDFR